MFNKISPCPSLPSGPGSAPEGLMPRREALWAGGQRGVLPPLGKGRLGGILQIDVVTILRLLITRLDGKGDSHGSIF